VGIVVVQTDHYTLCASLSHQVNKPAAARDFPLGTRKSVLGTVMLTLANAGGLAHQGT
jgi:hypothetical protein